MKFCRFICVGAAITSMTVWVPSPLIAAEAGKPGIVPRTFWGAAPPNEAIMRPQKQTEIVVHHTAAAQKPAKSLEVKLKDLQQFSQKPAKVGTKTRPAWGDVPYHYYIDVSGRIGEGRSVNYAGDTNTNYDTINRIQIVVEGEFDQEKPSEQQLVSLRKLVTWLLHYHGIGPDKISGHADNARTACPGKNLKPFIAELRKQTQLR